jgi:hypothetical protein
MARKTGRLDFSARNYIFGADLYCTNLRNFLEQIFVLLKISQNRDFIFLIHSHVDVYLKSNIYLCSYVRERDSKHYINKSIILNSSKKQY